MTSSWEKERPLGELLSEARRRLDRAFRTETSPPKTLAEAEQRKADYFLYLYWRPVMHGLVRMSREEYDLLGPEDLAEINALIDKKAQMEEESIQRAISEAQNK